MYFEIVKTKGESQWHARVRGDNNRIVFWTQNYDTKADAEHACKIVQEEAAAAVIPEKSTKEEVGSPIRLI